MTPPADSNVDFSLGITATTTEDDGATAISPVATLNVDVVGVADTPSVSVTDAQGFEDTAIALDVTPQLADVDGSESITLVTITGVPAGANLSLGSDSGGGTWTITDPADLANLANLTVTPPADSNVDFSLGITATTTEDDGATAISPVCDAERGCCRCRGHAICQRDGRTRVRGYGDCAGRDAAVGGRGRLGEHHVGDHHGCAGGCEPVSGFGLRWWDVDDHGPCGSGQPCQSDGDAACGLERRLLAGDHGDERRKTMVRRRSRRLRR